MDPPYCTPQPFIKKTRQRYSFSVERSVCLQAGGSGAGCALGQTGGPAGLHQAARGGPLRIVQQTVSCVLRF